MYLTYIYIYILVITYLIVGIEWAKIENLWFDIEKCNMII